MSIAPISGAVTSRALALAGRSELNAAEHTRTMIEALDRGVGAAVVTPLVNGRVDDERGNLVSVIA